MSIITVHDGISTLNGTANQIALDTTGRFALAGDHDITLSIPDAFYPVTVNPTTPRMTAASGTGVTVAEVGQVTRLLHKVTMTYAAFSAGALTADKTIITLPKLTRLCAIYADTTAAFTGGAVSAATLTVGLSAGAAEILASHDVFTAPILVGDLDADMGTSNTRAAAIQGAYLSTPSSTQILSARLTTVTANTSALTAGSVTFYIITESLIYS